MENNNDNLNEELIAEELREEEELKAEEEFENEFFKEEKKSAILIPIIISALVLVAAFCAMAFLLYEKIQNKDIVLKPVITTEEEAAPTPTATPADVLVTEAETPSPVEAEEPEVEEDFWFKTPVPDVMETDVIDYSKVEFDVKRNLSEMEGYFQENNLEALSDLAHLDRYIAMSYYFRGTSDYAYYGDLDEEGRPDGIGIAVYADNQYYYGQWKHGMRQGGGVWQHYHIHLKTNLTDIITYHQYIGKFDNDIPNGQGQDHYEFDPDMLEDNAYYITNYIGEFKDGYINGEVYCTGIDGKGNEYEYSGNAEAGSFIYLSESRDKNKRGPVLMDKENPDNYIWLSAGENQKIGVSSYISKNNINN